MIREGNNFKGEGRHIGAQPQWSSGRRTGRKSVGQKRFKKENYRVIKEESRGDKSMRHDVGVLVRKEKQVLKVRGRLIEVGERGAGTLKCHHVKKSLTLREGSRRTSKLNAAKLA